MTLAEMAERAAMMAGQAGVSCSKCGCRDFRTYKTIPGVSSVFRYKACRLCGHKILTTSQTNERVIREIATETVSDADDSGEESFENDVL
jgi:hypothetical protein